MQMNKTIKQRTRESSEGANPRNGGIKWLTIISGLIFVTSLVVHLATFASHPAVSMESTLFIHVAVFVPFGSMVIISARRKRGKAKDTRASLLERFVGYYVESLRIIGRIVRMVPTPVLILGIILLIYVPINFILFIDRMWEGSPNEDNGIYYLSDHGRYVRELTKEEYFQYQAYEVRGFSGHWMVLSFIPLVYFVFIHDRIRTSPSNNLAYSEPYK